ncbi:MAG: RNA polymerase sigma-70 factor, partial [Ignavibacteriaceae bacterium]|nr:RNA polymerase sigma-70 factor [Ignavibacteriaceae bacterium]
NKIRSGDSAAFEALFNFYCQQLINFARRYVFDKQIAENVVQDVFVNVWQSRTNLDPSKMIKAYLFTAVKNNSLKHLRHLNIENKGIESIPTNISDDERPDRKLNEKELDIKVHQAIDELPEKCKEIFKLNRFENLKYVEIAKILNISIKTVETQMGRALKKLRERLKPFLTIILFVLTSILILTI